MQKYIIIIAVLLSASPLWAQQELSTHFMRNTWQANRTNPALAPDYNIIVGLPGLYNNLTVENITFNTLFTEENGQQVLNIDAAIAEMEADNAIRENLDIETLGVMLRFGKVGVSLSHAFRFNAFMEYPKALPQLIWQGNAQFIGQEIEFAPKLDIFGYQEFAAGAFVDITENFTLGGRAKLLSGAGSISSEREQLRLNTDADVYQLTLNADYLVNSAGSLDYNGFDEVETNFDFANFGDGNFFSGNTGFAFDLGASLRLGKLELAASVLDIGNIAWEEEVKNYSLDGVFEYEGLDFAQGILEDSTEFGSVLDTIEQIYEVEETSVGYETTLPTRYYLSATYQLNEKLTLGGLFYGESYRGEMDPVIAVAANMDVLPFLNIGGIYSFQDERFDNLGVNAALKLGPVQLMAATDNILTAFQPKNSNSANLRIGLSLLFAKRETD
jgi:hypothetical protein